MTAALVLAAGRSTRMGTQKLLLPYGEGTVLGQVVRQVLRSRVESVLGVAGANAPLLLPALEAESLLPRAPAAGRRLRVLAGPSASDMLGSVRQGLASLPPTDAVAVVLGDQPGIAAETIDSMLAAFAAGKGRLIVPACGGRRGHPLLFDSRYIPELLLQHDSTGLRGLLQAHPAEVWELAVGSPEMLADLDTPADYARALATRAGAASAMNTAKPLR
jgi:molybdenum cofactor cytidylyltransferase